MNLPAPLPPAEQAHCRRTAALSELLARLASLPDSEVRTVTQSALVHDIGKTAIPADILFKPGPLTEEERALMRMHTTVGAHKENIERIYGDAFLDITDLTKLPVKLAGIIKRFIRY